MRYAFTFRMNSNVAYPIVFFAVSEGVYPLFFFGFNVSDVLKYTAKYAEFSTEVRESVAYKLLTSAEVYSAFKHKYKIQPESLLGAGNLRGKKLSEIYQEVDAFELVLLTDVIIPARKVIDAVIESMVENSKFSKGFTVDVSEVLNNKSLSGIEPDFIREVLGNTMTFINGLIQQVNLSKIWAAVESVTTIDTKDSNGIEQTNDIYNNKFNTLESDNALSVDELTGKGCVEYHVDDIIQPMSLKGVEYHVDDIIQPISLKGVEVVETVKTIKKKSVSYFINKVVGFFKGLFVEPLVDVRSKEQKQAEPLVEVDPKERQQIEPLVETSIQRPRRVERVSLETVLHDFRTVLYEYKLDSIKLNHRTGNEKGINFELDTMSASNKGVRDLIVESFINRIDKGVDSGSIETLDSGSKKGTDAPTVVGGKPNVVQGQGVSTISLETLLKKIKGIETTNIEVDITDTKVTEIIETSVDKFRRVFIEPLVETRTTEIQMTEPVVEVRTPEEQSIEPIVYIDKPDIISVSAVTEINSQEYRDLRFGRRCRFKTGQAFDKIWLNPTVIPYDEEPNKLTIEAKISFKAMLDFILFVEQIMHVSRFFYGASRAVTAIDDIVRILEEWLWECRPEFEIPEEYEYLLRWYKWWADAERAKHLDDMELNGLTVLETVRDKMVDYFESRWGKRVVEYGADGMYIYSKDHSYIDRIRGKKHGYNNRLVDRKMMKDEYNISEKGLPYDVENDTKK